MLVRVLFLSEFLISLRNCNSKLTKAVLQLLLLTTLTGCFEKTAEITGQIESNFEPSLVGAKIRIVGSSIEATSDNDGKFRIPYVPGEFFLRIEAENYISKDIELKIADRVEYPLSMTKLIAVPPSGGMFLVGKQSYIRLLETESRVNEERGIKTYWIADKGLSWSKEIAPLAAEFAKATENEKEKKDFLIVDTDSLPTLPIDADGIRLGSVKSVNRSDAIFVKEKIEREGNLVFRRVLISAEKMRQGKIICFARMEDDPINGQQITQKTARAYCLSGSIDLPLGKYLKVLFGGAILPNAGLAGLKIGDPLSKSVELLGTLHSQEQVIEDNQKKFIELKYEFAGVKLFIYADVMNRIIKEFWLQSDYVENNLKELLPTVQGIRLGSTFEEVEKKLGSPKKIHVRFPDGCSDGTKDFLTRDYEGFSVEGCEAVTNIMIPEYQP